MRLLTRLSLAVLCCLPVASSQAGGALTVFYNVRPPYLVQEAGGAPSGLTGTPARQAFAGAGVAVQWTILPTNRQIMLIRENNGAYCAVGWFANAERGRFAKFTRAVYRDQGWMVLAHPDFALDEQLELEQVLARPGLRVLVKDKYSYGSAIDGLLARYKPTIAVSTGTTLQMLQSLGARSVDIMFVSAEEGRYLLANGGDKAGRLRLLRPARMPKGETRHIMCSRQVPDELIDKLNKAIRFNR